MRLFANANYDFISRRRKAYLVSGGLLLTSLVVALFFQFTQGSWIKYGVDFLGGTIVQVRFQEQTTVGELRSALAPGFPGSEITRFGSENEFLIRAAEFTAGETEVSDQITDLIRQRFGEVFEVVRTEAVGPKIGDELQRRALLAILLSFVLTMIYLAIRFEWRFGVAAVIATLHDTLLTLGLISIFRLEVSLPTVAAVLTIIGYSLNDTIIVFDRVRENLGKTGRRERYIDILNRSINETLPRTVLTSGTTLLALLALFLLGGAIIRDFALILFLGILIGTYSSVFVAAPALLEIEERWGHKDPKTGRTTPPRPRRSAAPEPAARTGA